MHVNLTISFFKKKLCNLWPVWKLKKEGEYGRGRESNSITLFGSFLRNGGEGFGRVPTTSNPSFLISPNWRDLDGE